MIDTTIPELASLVRLTVNKWHHGQCSSCSDSVAEEVPVAFVYNGISHVVMMASPHDLEDYALGFSLSEGILGDRSELHDCEVSESEHGIEVQMQIGVQRFAALKDRRRNLTGRTGCGLCGTETLQQAIRRPPSAIGQQVFSASSIYDGFHAMQEQQRVQQHTGATHAAAWISIGGQVDIVREDIGRHNALDKMIGALARDRRDFVSGAALITSRASYEMVQKAATVGIGFLAAISAPTSLAVQLAEQANVTLVGFVRHRSHVVYTGSHRLTSGAGLDGSAIQGCKLLNVI